MPIVIHFGNPRQGKSYAAVRDQILPALAEGRRVVTNVEGMGDPDRKEKIAAYLKKKYKFDGDIDLFFVPHSSLEKEKIFPVDTKQEDESGTRIFDDSDSVVKFGTLIVWDEARSFSTENLPKSWHEALTYHGHWARDGRCVDIVLIHQNWKSLAPIVRATSELVFEFVKDVSGKGYARYRYANPGDRELSRRAKTTFREHFAYDKAIYELYKTNSSDGQVNDNIRVSPFKSSRIRFLLAVIVILIFSGIAAAWWGTRSFYKSATGGKVNAVKAMSNGPHAEVIYNGPSIVGKIPGDHGLDALVKDGDNFIQVPVRSGLVVYNGHALVWPSDF